MVRLFVYGTLKTDGRNYHKLPAGSRKKGVLEGYTIIDGRAPRLVPKEGSRVEGEVVEAPLSRLGLLRLDLFEWAYRRVRVVVGGEECWAYVWRKGFKQGRRE